MRAIVVLAKWAAGLGLAYVVFMGCAIGLAFYRQSSEQREREHRAPQLSSSLSTLVGWYRVNPVGGAQRFEGKKIRFPVRVVEIDPGIGGPTVTVADPGNPALTLKCWVDEEDTGAVGRLLPGQQTLVSAFAEDDLASDLRYGQGRLHHCMF